MSRSRLASRLLGTRRNRQPSTERGLIFLQIDGLARTQLDHALRRGRMPFVRKLVLRGDYELVDFYSGLPSSTPAVQGEIFFGVRTAVPSFSFYDRAAGVERRMFDPESARLVASELTKKSDEPLLKGGSSYSNIYAAGADCARFCSERLDLPSLLKDVSLVRIAMLFLMYWPKFIRIAALGLIEIVTASVDCVRGVIAHQDLFKELKFIPTRLGISVVLRELIEFMIRLDIDEGVPVIHANLLGYDEQAHRRGPDSRFAHWTLGGLDRLIRDVSRAALRSTEMDYEIVVYSDHGQERTITFQKATGRSLEEAVRETFVRLMPSTGVALGEGDRRTTLHWRAKSLLRRGAMPPERTIDPESIVVSDMGPVAQIYVPGLRQTAGLKATAAEMLAGDGGVPMVLYVDERQRVMFATEQGSFSWEEDAVKILGSSHPFEKLVIEDLKALCLHHYAGDLIACGWRSHAQPLSFANENGAHGGIGSEETRGFVLAPKGFLQREIPSQWVRGEDLYHSARCLLGREGSRQITPRSETASSSSSGPIRLVTYNIHSCVGLDGRLRPERVARVLQALEPDIVALQEVDAYRPRSRRDHQAEMIATCLGMQMHFYSLLEHEDGEEYGLAICSRFPFTIVRKSPLTHAHPASKREARGVLWAEIMLPGGASLHVMNTHFGLGGRERSMQADILLGDGWLQDVPAEAPVVVCGDFNSRPGGRVYRRFTQRLVDAQTALPIPTNHRTFPSIMPLFQLDHIFTNRRIAVQGVQRPRTSQSILASDHLPLCVQISCRYRRETRSERHADSNPQARASCAL